MNSFYHIKLFNTEINCFNSQNHNLASPSLSSTKNKLKKSKIKFDTKIKFFKIKGIGYLIAKNYGKLK